MNRLTMTSQDVEGLARALLKVDFFSNFTVSELDEVLRAISLYEFPSGEYVFKQGDSGDAFYIVQTGTVDVLMKNGLFFKKKVASLDQGKFFGEIALMESSPRTATIKSNGARLYVLLATDFQQIVAKTPKFAEELRKVVARRKFEAKN